MVHQHSQTLRVDNALLTVVLNLLVVLDRLWRISISIVQISGLMGFPLVILPWRWSVISFQMAHLQMSKKRSKQDPCGVEIRLDQPYHKRYQPSRSESVFVLPYITARITPAMQPKPNSDEAYSVLDLSIFLLRLN